MRSNFQLGKRGGNTWQAREKRKKMLELFYDILDFKPSQVLYL